MTTPSEITTVDAHVRVTATSTVSHRGRILLGRFRLGAVISRGGMGSVYMARDIHNGARYAAKILRNDVTLIPRVRERFLLEAQTMKGIRHPSVVKIEDVGETSGGELFFIMEYVNGPPLRRLLRSGPLETDRMRLLTASIAEGLCAAHANGVIHRDLKPENILIPRDRQADSIVKIVDFGIARLLGTPRITTTRQVLGTPSYISPEQAMGSDVIDDKTDIYSLGVIMYEMLSGRLPFSGATPEELLERHIRSVPDLLCAPQGCASLHPAMVQLVMSCLEKSPKNRPDNMVSVLKALEEIF